MGFRHFTTRVAGVTHQLWRPATALYLTVAILKSGALGFILPMSVWNILQVLPVIVFVVLGVLSLKKTNPSITRLKIVIAFACFLLAAGLSAIGNDPKEVLVKCFILGLMLVFLYLTFSHRWVDRAQVTSDLYFLFWFSCLVQVIGLAVAATGSQSAIGPYARFTGVLSNANYAGMMSALAFSIFLHLVVRAHSRVKVLLIVGAFVHLTAIFFSDSRGSAAAVLVGVLVSLALHWRKKVGFVILASEIAGLALLPVILVRSRLSGSGVLPGVVLLPGSDLIPTDDRLSGSDLSSGRFDLYALFARDWLRSPIQGHGYGSSQGLSGGLEPHNIFLSTLVETGIIGAAAFLVAIIFVFRAGRWSSLLPAAVTVLTIEMTESSLFGWGSPTAILSWFALLAYAAYGTPIDSEVNQSQSSEELAGSPPP